MRLTNHELYASLCATFPPTRLVFRPSTDSWVLDGNSVTQGELIRLIAFQLDAGTQRVQVMLTQRASEARKSATQSIRDWLTKVEAMPRSDRELRRWLRLMERAGTSPQDHEAHVQTMKQWLWQVKRGIREQKVVWHVAPIFWSKEGGTGKSTNVLRIVKPVEAFTRNVSVDELSEKFSGRLFAQTLVAFLDEFAGVEKTDVGMLKSILTGKPIDRRSMHSESGFYSANRMSAIATSNLAPPHGFIDSTGARRFWSIHCSGENINSTSDRARGFDAIDVQKVWASVSVDDECPHYTAKPSVLEHMEQQRNENLRTKTSLEAFAEDSLEVCVGDRLPLRDLQQAYKDYCTRTRQVPLRGGYREMAKRLKDMNLTVYSPNNRFYLLDHTLCDDRQEVA